MRMEDYKKLIKDLIKDHPIFDLIKFSELNIQEKLMKNPYYIIKYKELYYKETSILNNLEIKYNKLLGIRYKYYRFNDNKEWKKAEIEKYCLPSDKFIIKMKKIIENQKIRVNFFENAYKGFESAGWRMKTFCDIIRSGF